MRCSFDQIKANWEGLSARVVELLATIQTDMLERARRARDEQTTYIERCDRVVWAG